jgi:hypothetical protein
MSPAVREKIALLRRIRIKIPPQFRRREQRRRDIVIERQSSTWRLFHSALESRFDLFCDQMAP